MLPACGTLSADDVCNVKRPLSHRLSPIRPLGQRAASPRRPSRYPPAVSIKPRRELCVIRYLGGNVRGAELALIHRRVSQTRDHRCAWLPPRWGNRKRHTVDAITARCFHYSSKFSSASNYVIAHKLNSYNHINHRER